MKSITQSITTLRHHYDRYQRKYLGDPTAERQEVAGLVRYLWHYDETAVILYTQLNTTTADEAIMETIDYFTDLDYIFEWKHYSYDSPPDLAHRLQAQGLIKAETEAVMVLTIADAPANLRQLVTYDIRKATSREMMADADHVCYTVWKDFPHYNVTPTHVTERVYPLYENNPDNVSLYIVYIDDQPVSYGRIEFPVDNPFASLWGGTVLPAYRRQGIYQQLVVQRLQEAHARGRQYLTVDARTKTSMPILQKLGFVTIGMATAYNSAQ